MCSYIWSDYKEYCVDVNIHRVEMVSIVKYPEISRNRKINTRRNSSVNNAYWNKADGIN